MTHIHSKGAGFVADGQQLLDGIVGERRRGMRKSMSKCLQAQTHKFTISPWNRFMIRYFVCKYKMLAHEWEWFRSIKLNSMQNLICLTSLVNSSSNMATGIHSACTFFRQSDEILNVEANAIATVGSSSEKLVIQWRAGGV